ncbi:DUF1353 domain-containing protein [Georgenia sp. H159]|uniref:DUF1353 domain-containing protein n=1 Tax=Georgenia sp. H159 TaxID=3076115 RepID=UPI002D7A135C|nr:DUF1353 domain-containing protein [Georgenia sp. H159]
MPFVRKAEDGRWRACTTVDLRQLPERSRLTVRFEVLQEFGYTDQRPDGRDDAGPTWSRTAVDHVVPAGFVTDLASVPELLWGVIASYGRQTLPAVLHDTLYRDASAVGTAPEARRLRRVADVLFRATLRESGAGPVRQWMMWAAVRTFGSPVVVVPLVVLAVVLLAVGVLAVGGWLTAPAIAWGTVLVAAVGLLSAMVITSVEDDGGRVRFRPTSLASLLGAAAIALASMPPVIVVIVVTAAVRAVVELGERPVAWAVDGPSGELVAATARITWSPLLARVPEAAEDGRVD